MKIPSQLFSRILLPLAAAACLSACNLTLATVVQGTPQVIVVTATPQSGAGESQGQPPPAGQETAPTMTPSLTLTPTITPTATPALPAMTAGQDLSCVEGPHWIFYEWVAKIVEGEVVTLTARSSAEWPDYFYVRKSNGTECWAFSGSSTISGDTSTLPVREAPPLPEVEYTIENKTGLPVVSILIREKDAAAWGANKLTATLVPGATFSLTLTAGYYDVLVQDLAAGKLYEKYDWPIGSDPNYRNIALDAEFEFYIQNNYAFDLCRLDVKPSGGAWKTLHGAADGNITPGNRFTFSLLPAFYDLRIWRCSGPLIIDAANVYFGPSLPGYNIP
ncbi:MAG: hypothetical protein JW929_04605 [Anaerolineales bacterium]|nr:hypothetical protein [Anaerolineales bacterium]